MGAAGGHRGTVGIEVSANGLKQVNLASGLRCFNKYKHLLRFLKKLMIHLKVKKVSIKIS